MKPKRCSIKFFLKLNQLGNIDGYPINCRIIYDRKKAEFSTKIYIKKEKWSVELEEPIRTPRVKHQLIKIKSDILDYKTKLEYQKKPITAKILRDYHKQGEPSHEIYFLEYLGDFISKKQTLGDVSSGRIKRYKVTVNHFRSFLESTINQTDILITEIERDFVDDFHYFLRTKDKGMKNSSAANYHKVVKMLLDIALKNKLILSNPYDGFDMKIEKVERVYLSMEELVKLQSFPFEKDSTFDKVRDIFVFSCYCGLRYSDAQALTKDSFSKDSENNFWLSFMDEKTKKKHYLPLLSHCVNIYEKYKYLREVTGRVLPKMTNQQINKNIKKVAEMIGIQKHLTHHIARHTFRTTIASENGIPVEVAQVFLGHSSIRTTMIYYKITNKRKLANIKMLEEKLKTNKNEN